MKPRSSCELCRQRRRKCVVRAGAERCNACEEANQTCQLTPKFRFRHMDNGARRRPRRSPSQPGHGHPAAPGNTDRAPAGPSTPSETGTEGGSVRHGVGSDAPAHDAPEADESCSVVAFFPSLKLPKAATVTSIAYLLDHSPAAASPSSPIRQTECRQSARWAPSPRQRALPSARLTGREAYLMRLYTQRLAPLSDACDEARHFGLTLPRLALAEPVIFYGILALASRYDALDGGQSGDMGLESTYYYSRCIELLIRALARPPGTYNPIILAAVVLSRLYEELGDDAETQQYHLSGTRNLLRHEVVARFARDCDVAEAVSWVYLRQAINACIVRRRPLDMPLEVFETFSAFRTDDDSSWANRAVYIFAKVVRFFFSSRSGGPSADQPSDGVDPRGNWDALERELEGWHDEKPSSFESLYEEPPDLEGGRPFPFMWMALTVPVVAMQHYYASRILVHLHRSDEASSNVGFEAARRRLGSERAISSCLCILMGLALANEQAAGACYLPSHMLSLCGYCIRHPTERAQTAKYLERVREVVRWKTGPLIASLEQQWAELDGLGP